MYAIYATELIATHRRIFNDDRVIQQAVSIKYVLCSNLEHGTSCDGTARPEPH